MNDETTPIWREAAKDPNHPLHEATWTLFREKMHLKRAAARLEPNKDTVIPYLLDILRNKDLRFREAIGDGYAPVNAAQLLGHWQVTEAIPDLWDILGDEEEETSLLWEAAIDALESMGPVIVDTAGEFIEQNPDMADTAASILSVAASGDERAYELIRGVFEQSDSENWATMDYVSESLLYCDREQAIPYLEERIKTTRYNKDVRERLKENIQQAKAERDREENA